MSRRPTERGGEIISTDTDIELDIVTHRTSLDAPREFAKVKAITQFKIEKKKKKMTVEELKKEIEMEEHLLTLDELAKKFPKSRINPKDPEKSEGLSDEDAKQILQVNGKNKLTPPKKTHWIVRFIKQFLGFFSLLLLAGSVLCFIAWLIEYISNPAVFNWDNLLLGAVLFVVVFITSVFSFAQETKSAKMMEGFKNLIPEKATVIRNGQRSTIDAEDVVVGDIVVLREGDRIPADIRIIAQKGLKVDNSSLTGESELQARTAENTHENPLETKNLVFFGTYAKKGTAIGMVVFTGDFTMIGKIAGLAQGEISESTPLHMEINRFIYIISAIAIFLGVTFLIIGFIIGTHYVSNFIFMIGIIVANVPEGLLATVTVSLTLTAQRMSKKFVLVKNLESVETLGSTTTIASDKTGTLTQNRMTVAHVWYDDSIYRCATNKSETHGFDTKDETFFHLQRVASLCNNAAFDVSDPKNLEKPILERKCVGDASEEALLKFCEPLRNVMEYRKANEKIGEIPFNSENKWQLSIHIQENVKDPRKLLVMKGAPERIFSFCSKIMIDGKEQVLDDKWKEKFQSAYETLGSYGERVLGFAHYYLPLDKYPENYPWKETDNLCETMGLTKEPIKDLTFLGLISMIDPPREGVPEAVQKCKQAGIRVIMVTGDHPITAVAIARQVGIIEGDTVQDVADQMGIPVSQVAPERAVAEVVKGEDIPKLSEKDWDRILSKRQIVFARTSPQQKLIIVEHCQARGEIVAVTGDGVNDSPALKKANIGIAMGIGGSAVSKEAADMILMDDNFASIVNGIEEGRIIFDNLKKSIAYTLSSNIPEISPFLVFITLGIPLPLGTILILCIDLGTDMIPAISLAYEKAESDIMLRKPRDPKVDNLVTGRLIGFAYFQIGMIQAVAGFFSYFIVMADYGFPPHTLPGLGRQGYFVKGAPPIRSIYGDIYDDVTQRDILAKAQTAYFVTIVITQWADLIICKTRRLSLFQQGMRNNVMIFGLFFETAVAAFVSYIPWVNINVFGSSALKFVHWLPALPFVLFIFFYDELRKLYIRSTPNSWLERVTNW